MLDLFDEAVVQFPKPVELMKRLIEQATTEQDIILDFFAGSGTTGQAVIDLSRQDGESRRFVLVQFPEPAPHDSPALELGLENIAEVGKERIRRVIAKIHESEDNGQLQLDLSPDEDLGFKVFKLAPSTFRQWEPPEGEEAEALEEQLALFDRGLEQGADPRDVIYEVILKLGYSLNSTIEPLKLETNRVYRVTDEVHQSKVDQTLKVSETFRVSPPPTFFVCLDDHLQTATLDALPLDNETTFVCLDTALDDSQKVNLAMQCLLKVI
jgi:adenine-specific DNA-methyltransferase